MQISIHPNPRPDIEQPIYLTQLHVDGALEHTAQYTTEHCQIDSTLSTMVQKPKCHNLVNKALGVHELSARGIFSYRSEVRFEL